MHYGIRYFSLILGLETQNFNFIHFLIYSALEWQVKCFCVQGAYDKFPDFFRMDIFIDRTHMKL